MNGPQFSRVGCLLTVGLCCWGSSSFAQSTARDGEVHVAEPIGKGVRPKRVIVKFRRGTATDKRAALHQAHGHQVERTIPQLDMQAIRVPPGRTVEDVIGRYRQHPLVEFAEVESFRQPALTPNDPWFTNWQIDLQQMGAPAAWDVTTGSPDVPVAVLDSGLDIEHYEFVDRIASGEIYG
ncbi:MAG: S8 family serine peptidase, partial [Planctomycetota bacterium]